MKNSKKLLLSASLLGFAVLGMVASGVAQVTPSQDAYTNSVDPTTNYGTSTTLGVVSSATSIQTAYIQFDLSSIPAGYTSSNIAKATLKVYINSVTTAGSFNVDFVNGTWEEKKITASLSPALGSTIVSSVPLTNANVHDYVLIDVTTAVGDWLNGTQANDGIALVANSPLAATIDSKENTSQSHPAELDIVFSGSGGGGGGTVTSVGSGAGLTGGPITTSGTLSVATGGVTNTMLQHPSLTLNPGAGMTGGGAVSLGSTTTLGLITSCASGQLLKWNGSAWACAADANSGGTVTSAAFSAPASDFTVSGSPITTSGTLNLNWNVAPTNANTANAIVKRDASGNFSAGSITATGALSTGGTVTAGGGLFTNVPGGTTAVFANSATGTGVFGEGGTGVIGESTSGIGVQGFGVSTGVYGKASATGGSANGVQGASTNATAVRGDDGGSGSGVVGTSASGYGVYASSSSGFSIGADNNATQARGAGGWAKAMVFVDPFTASGTAITRCYNSQASGATVNTPPCGFSIIHEGLGSDMVNFGFQVNDRFISATQFSANSITACVLDTNNGCFEGGISPNADQVLTVTVFYNGAATDSAFWIIVF